MARYDRVRTLFGDDFDRLQNSKVILLGVGGVGGVCLDCLFRSGIKDITIVDFDTFEITNQNRQLYSEFYLGNSKVKALKKHYKDITVIEQYIDEKWVEEFDFTDYDLVLDAIDNTKAKIALAKKCYKKLISSFGSANKTDASMVMVDNIWKSKGDKLGSKIRYELRKQKFDKNYKVIFSTQQVDKSNMGSFMGVTATFGLMMCSEAVKKLLSTQ